MILPIDVNKINLLMQLRHKFTPFSLQQTCCLALLVFISLLLLAEILSNITIMFSVQENYLFSAFCIKNATKKSSSSDFMVLCEQHLYCSVAFACWLLFVNRSC